MAVNSLALGSFILFFISQCSICMASCEDGWIENGGRCYFASSKKTNWYGAYKQCLLLDANLVDFEEEKASLRKITDAVEAFHGTDLIPLWTASNNLGNALCPVRNYHVTSKTFDSTKASCDEMNYYICGKAANTKESSMSTTLFGKSMTKMARKIGGNNNGIAEVETTKKRSSMINTLEQQPEDLEKYNTHIYTDHEDGLPLYVAILYAMAAIVFVIKVMLFIWCINRRSAAERKRQLINVSVVRPAATATEGENQVRREESDSCDTNRAMIFVLNDNNRRAAMESARADSQVIYD